MVTVIAHRHERDPSHPYHLLSYHSRQSLLVFHHSRRTRTRKEPTPIPSRQRAIIPHQLPQGNSATPFTERPTPFLVSAAPPSRPSDLTFPRRVLGPLPDRSRKPLILDAHSPIREDWLRTDSKKEEAIRWRGAIPDPSSPFHLLIDS